MMLPRYISGLILLFSLFLAFEVKNIKIPEISDSWMFGKNCSVTDSQFLKECLVLCHFVLCSFIVVVVVE